MGVTWIIASIIVWHTRWSHSDQPSRKKKVNWSIQRSCNKIVCDVCAVSHSNIDSFNTLLQSEVPD